MSSAHPPRLGLLGLAAMRDLATYLARLERVGEPEVFLQVSRDHTSVAVYGCTKPPQGLLSRSSVVLVMRAFSLASAPGRERPPDGRLVARADLARSLDLDSTALQLPSPAPPTSWSGIMPPGDGWHLQGDITEDSLIEVAKQGSERVAKAVPTGAGAAVSERIRSTVWETQIAQNLPAAAAFAAWSMGFLREGRIAKLWSSHTWTRLATFSGNVLIR